MSSTAIFDHIGLSVGDLDAAIDWYSRALDLREDFHFDRSLLGVDGWGKFDDHDWGLLEDH